jgi:hypothetical protein
MSATSWSTDIRKTALLVCITTVLGVLIPVRNALQQLRRLSAVTALVSGLILAKGLWDWIGSPTSHWTISQAPTILNALSLFAFILLLLAFSRQPNRECSADAIVPVSSLPRITTKVALVAWGVWVAWNVVRLCLTPYSYFQLRNFALQLGRQPPQLGAMMTDITRTLLEQACLFMGPYIVYNAWPRRD